jgi:hypothetical protein
VGTLLKLLYRNTDSISPKIEVKCFIFIFLVPLELLKNKGFKLKTIPNKIQYTESQWFKSRGIGIPQGSSDNVLLFSGSGICSYWLTRNLNTVRRLVLRKGGKHLSIITYGIFGKSSKVTTVPVQHVRFIRFFTDNKLSSLTSFPLRQNYIRSPCDIYFIRSSLMKQATPDSQSVLFCLCLCIFARASNIVLTYAKTC